MLVAVMFFSLTIISKAQTPIVHGSYPLSTGIFSSSNNIENGNYYATVKYNNWSTAYYEKYTLIVTVKNGKVTKIHFDDGYLHDGINYSGYFWSGGSLDSNESTRITITEGTKTKTFDITLD